MLLNCLLKFSLYQFTCELGENSNSSLSLLLAGFAVFLKGNTYFCMQNVSEL